MNNLNASLSASDTDKFPEGQQTTGASTTTPQSTVNYHTQQRYDRLLQFVKSAFPQQDFKIETLAGDASFRRYHRIYFNKNAIKDNGSAQAVGTAKLNKQMIDTQNDVDPSYIIMDAPPELESIESFVRIDELMAETINVPTLLAIDIEQGFLILQDFGTVEFAHLLADAKEKQDDAHIDKLYRWAIDSLMQLQSLDVTHAKQAYAVANYDAATLQREMNLFSEWFLPYIGVPLDEKGAGIWQTFSQGLIDLVLQQPKVVVHRDYHSRNLMRDQYHQNELGVIDFQDTLIGSYAYDLVSLVRDAYVDWSEEQVQSWISYYWQQRKQANLQVAASLAEFITDVNLIGVQRHLKVLGIFVRLAERDGKQRYLADIPKVWRDLIIEIEQLAAVDSSELKALVQPFANWLHSTVSEKFQQKF